MRIINKLTAGHAGYEYDDINFGGAKVIGLIFIRIFLMKKKVRMMRYIQWEFYHKYHYDSHVMYLLQRV